LCRVGSLGRNLGGELKMSSVGPLSEVDSCHRNGPTVSARTASNSRYRGGEFPAADATAVLVGETTAGLRSATGCSQDVPPPPPPARSRISFRSARSNEQHQHDGDDEDDDRDGGGIATRPVRPVPVRWTSITRVVSSPAGPPSGPAIRYTSENTLNAETEESAPTSTIVERTAGTVT